MSDSDPTASPGQKCRMCEMVKDADEFRYGNLRCRDCMRVVQRERYLANREELLERARQYYRDNADERRAYVREYRKTYDTGEVREKRLARSRERYRENLDYEKQRSRSYYEKNREKWLDYTATRRAARGDTTEDIQARIKQLRKQPCDYCGGRELIEIDHVVPLSRGGKHEVENLAPACRACNRSKHNKLLSEWKGVPIG